MGSSTACEKFLRSSFLGWFCRPSIDSFFKRALGQTNICCSRPSTDCASMPQHFSNKELLTAWWDGRNSLRNPNEMSGMWIPFQRLISIQASATTHSQTAGAFRYLNASILSTAAACWQRSQPPCFQCSMLELTQQDPQCEKIKVDHEELTTFLKTHVHCR